MPFVYKFCIYVYTVVAKCLGTGGHAFKLKPFIHFYESVPWQSPSQQINENYFSLFINRNICLIWLPEDT